MGKMYHAEGVQKKFLRGLKRTLRLPLGELDPDRPPTAEKEAQKMTCSDSKYWGCRFGTPEANESKALKLLKSSALARCRRRASSPTIGTGNR